MSIKKESGNTLSSSKGIAHILVVIVLLIGLVAAVYLVQTKTNFLPKAASLDYTSAPINPPKTQPYLHITDPAGGTIWRLGQNVKIKWIYQGNKKLDIYVRSTTNDKAISKILSGGENTGYFDWTVESLPAGTYQVLLRGSNGSESNSGIMSIEVSGSAYLKIIKPAADEILIKGVPYRIRWERGGNPKVDLYWKSLNNPNKPVKFATAINNFGYYTWDTKNVPIKNKSFEQFQIIIKGSEGSSIDSGIFTLKSP
jgi:hypothetical protein